MSVKFSTWRQILPAALIGASAYLASGVATAADTAAAGAPLEEVVITGSRIPVPANITATSPMTVVSSQAIEQSGKTDIIDVLNSLGQNAISTGTDFGNNSNPLSTAGGTATADLRGLGPQRTLVLVNGRRLGIGDPNTGNPNPAPDLDQIPTALVERVEVVTGGASATYGSDAVAGVVNFIMRRNFEGVEISGQYGSDWHDQHSFVKSLLANDDPNTGWKAVVPPTGSVRDGKKHDLSIVMGTNIAGGDGNITSYFVYHNQDAVPGSARDFSSCQGITLDPTGATNPYGCLGSSNSNRFQVPGLTPRLTVVGNQFVPWPNLASNPPPIFNFNKFEYDQRGDERYQAGLMAHLDLKSWAKPYLEFGYMNDKTNEEVAPSGLFVGQALTPNGRYIINCTNPLLSPQEQATICSPAQIAADTVNPGTAAGSVGVNIGRRNVEGGGRHAFFEHTNFRVVAGMQGSLGEAWNYDAYGQYYYTTLFNSNLRYLDLRRSTTPCRSRARRPTRSASVAAAAYRGTSSRPAG